MRRIRHISGTGTLYEADDRHAPLASQRRAVKEIIFGQADGDIAAEDFLHKAEVLTTLSHPTIPRIFDYFIISERAYLVTEFVQGRDLEDILFDSNEKLPITAIHQWALELCDALHYLHTRRPHPIIFRDVKPANIMIDQRLNARLVDFGISVVLSDTRAYEPLGTDGYAAPEQYIGEVSPSIDIYGLGATLHHLLTRHDPRLEAPFSFHTRPIRSINPAVPPDFAAVVMRAVSYYPWDRYHSAQEMLEALERIDGIH